MRVPSLSCPNLLPVLIASLVCLATRPAPAATVSWINPDGGNWSTAANWSGGAVPATTDEVLITLTGTYSVNLDGHVSIAALTLGGPTGEQTLTLSGTTLTLANASSVEAGGVLGLNGGMLTCGATLAIRGRLTWTGGWIVNGAPTTIAPGGIASLSGAESKGLAGTLNNQGHLNWSGGGQIWQNAGQLNNQAGGVFEAQTDGATIVVGGTPTNFNAGRILKSGGAGVTSLGVPLVNTGVLEARTGVISYAAGSVFGSGSSFTGAGVNLLAQPGVMTLEGTTQSENLELGGGNTVLAGTNVLHGSLTWTRGWIGGAAVMTIAPDGLLSLAGDENKGVAGTLNNQGRVVWSGGGQIWQSDGRINNEPTGVFEAQTDTALLINAGTPVNFNAGRILKSGGAGVTSLGVPLVNTGVLEARTGVISYAAGSVFGSGSSFTGAGVNLLAQLGVMTLDGAIHSENLEIGGAIIAGTNTITGTVAWTRQWIGGAAVMTIAANGTLRLVGVEDKGLAGTLNNLGHIVWSDDGHLAMGGGTLNNLPGGVFEAQNDRGAYHHSGTPLIHNAGLMRKSAGTGVTTLGVAFSNTGTVDTQTGIVSLAANATLGAGSRFLGAGTNLLANGVITLEGAIHSENLEIGGAIIAGTNTITGTVAWTRQWIGGAALMTIATNGTLRLVGVEDKGLAGTLNNLGHIVWSDDGHLAMGGGTLNNLPEGVFEAQNDRVVYYHSGTPLFHNAGRFRKLGGNGATIIQNVPFDNPGMVDAQTGLVLFACPYTQTGGRLNLGLNSLTDFGRIQFAGTALLTGTLGANLNNGYRPRAGDAFTVVTYPARAGAFTDFALPTSSAWVTNDTIYSATDVTLTVLNAQPVLAMIGDRSLDEETLLTVSSTVDHPDVGQTVTYSLTQGPSNAQIDPTTGVLTWTPTELQGPSTHFVTVRATDNGTPPLSDSQTFGVIVWEVNRPPLWTAPASLTADELQFLQIPGVATDPDFPANTLTFSLVSPPTGAQMNPATGVITWTPSEAQGPTTAALQVRVIDDGGPPLSITNQIAVTVREVNAGPVLTVPGPQTLDELTALNLTSTAVDADLPANTLTFSLLSPPTGAQIDPTTGVITWTPTEAQGPTNATLRVRITDNGSPAMSDTREISATVREVNAAPVLTVPGPQALNELAALTLTNTAVDTDLPANTLTFSLLSPPTGAQIDPTTGVITWTPTEAQGPTSATIRVRVEDNGTPPMNDAREFTVTVREVNTAPALTVPGPRTLDELTTLTVTNTVLDGDLPANTLAFSLESAPAGVQINPATGVITWTPTEAQGPTNATIRVRVEDNGTPPMNDAREFTVTVREVNRAPVLAAIPDQTIVESLSLAFTNVVTDPDLPGNVLTFSLVAPPPGFAIDPMLGVLTWTPSPGQIPSTHRVTVRVADNGVPARWDEESFDAAVVPLPFLRIALDGEQVRIFWPAAAPGFVLQSTADPHPPMDWRDVTNALGQVGDDRVVTNRVADGPQFFRLRRP
jgi:hypothetical protein